MSEMSPMPEPLFPLHPNISEDRRDILEELGALRADKENLQLPDLGDVVVVCSGSDIKVACVGRCISRL